METEPTRKPQRKKRGAGYAIGAFAAEIDQRLLRNLPPVEELVAKGDAIRGLSGEAGAFDLGSIRVTLPRPEAEPARADPSPTPTGRVTQIHIAHSAGEPMIALDQVEAIADVGLEGDRYANQTGHWSPIARHGERLTLIAQEEIARLGTDYGVWVGSSRVDLQACKLEYSIVSPK